MAAPGASQQPSSQASDMTGIKGDRLHVRLSASGVRRRLKGLGYGVRKIQSAGRNEAIIIHTATGQHLRELMALLQDVIVTPPSTEDSAQTPRAGESGRPPGTETADD